MNMFLEELTKENTVTMNGALSNSSSGCSLLDYFAKCGSYRGRSLEEVSGDMASIFGTDEDKAMRIVLYNRMITRKPVGFESVQRGQGQKDEFVKSLAWLQVNRPELLEKNIHLIPIVGCWKDLWYDSQNTKFYNYVDTDIVYPLVAKAMMDENQRQLVAKYLPKIRSSVNTKTDRHRRLNAWARGLCEYLGWTERDYRKFKSDPSNTAHNFQRVMCAGKWKDLDFSKVPGRALFNLVNGNVLSNHGLEKSYLKWIEKQPVAKFTGYPYELYKSASNRGNSLIKTYTYNAQFEKLLEVGRDSLPEDVLDKGVLCALDTSGSMTWTNCGNVTPLDVCLGLGIYFSSFLKGYFKDTVIQFSSKSKIVKLPKNGKFCDKVDYVNSHVMGGGSTNFQSVIDEIVRVRKKNPNVPISDYPKVLLVVSDMQFNPSGDYWARNDVSQKQVETNYQAAMRKLAEVGLPPMSIIWWDVNGVYGDDVPSTMFDEGTTLISGFDGSIVSAILGGQDEVVDEKTGEKRKLTPDEQMEKVLDQEVLNLVQV